MSEACSATNLLSSLFVRSSSRSLRSWLRSSPPYLVFLRL